MSDADDAVAVPFELLDPGDPVVIRWDSPRSPAEQMATGRVKELGEYRGKYGIEDGTPYVLIEPDVGDRELRVSERFGGEVESVTYTTYKSGNPMRIGALTAFEIVEESGGPEP